MIIMSPSHVQTSLTNTDLEHEDIAIHTNDVQKPSAPGTQVLHISIAHLPTDSGSVHVAGQWRPIFAISFRSAQLEIEIELLAQSED